ncbi:MAG: threonine synthase [Bacteroidota bacterium]
MQNKKFILRCTNCGNEFDGFSSWFANNQVCPECGAKHVEAKYPIDFSGLEKLMEIPDCEIESLWHYFDYLPLNSKSNIISFKEGAIPVERWGFLEDYAKEKHGLSLEVWVYRNDKNGGTGTFKDVAASLAASVLKEEGVKDYVVASTGNTATSFAKYLAMAGINAYIFMPVDALKASESEINLYGQKVFRVQGDYAMAKEIAADFAKKHNMLMTGGNVDPLRVEAKKTMVYEWIRQMGKLPDVYVQALSGGTGPIAIEKALRDAEGTVFDQPMPRQILVQPDKCPPMAMAWQSAVENNFPEGWNRDFPVIENPPTSVPTLATGKPGTYPLISELVRRTNGSIIQMKEDKIHDIARWIGYETKVPIGPASAVCMGGFLNALKENLIQDGECVLVNTGEGVSRAPQFMEELIYITDNVSSLDDCKIHDREALRAELISRID